MSALAKKGIEGPQNAYKKCKGTIRRQAFLGELMLCKDASSMAMMEEKSAEFSKEQKIIQGWMSKYQIWKLEGMAVCEETIADREAVIDSLQVSDCGKKYWYVYVPPEEQAVKKTKKWSATAKSTCEDPADWSTLCAKIDSDEVGRLANVDTAPKAKAKAHIKDKAPGGPEIQEAMY
jgi:hypothetical protein